MKTLSIIIPAYNEEKTIHLILDKIRDVELIGGVRKQVIIVNDHSSDQTEKVILKYKVDNPILDIQYCLHYANEGKGAAIRTGIQFVKGDFVIIQDADLEYDPNDYNLLLPLLLKGEKVVYGSRFLMKENKHSYKSFYLGGLLVTTVTNLLYNQNLTDEPTCYKAFQSDFLRSIPLVCTGFEFCPEVTAKVALRGYKIKEVPIHYYPRSVEEGKKIKWTDGVEALWVLFNYYRLHVQQRLLQACKKLSLTYLFLSVFCFLSILFVYWIPRSESMNRNLSDSLQTVLSEGIYKRAFVNMMLFDLDNPTNEIMLSKAAYYDKDHILQSALMNYSSSKEDILSGNYVSSENEMYGRYWHGYLLFLKPVLQVMNYTQIRYLSYLLIGLLIIGISILIYKKANMQATFAFMVSMIAVECYIVPLSLQLSTMFYVSLGAVFFLLLSNNLLNNRGVSVFFFIIGGLTGFFDFLTTPVLSLGLPLLVYILLNRRGEDWKLVIKSALCWGLGYASIWMTKWILVSALTDYNMIADAVSQAFLRMGIGSGNGVNPEVEQGNVLFERVGQTFANLPSNPTMLLILFFLGGVCGIFFLLPKKEHAYKNNIAYILIALIPIVWYAMLGNHTGIHWRFTHRSLAVTMFAGLLFLMNAIDWKRIKSPVRYIRSRR
ncbi:glycosyltransferase [uncultured Parabacteroides sp.]|uniref:glycosyltransferase family 2 protein n=1 Tax=uncultured Parabacteroides sp. TaxID=512312 RepID=UPI003447C08A